MFHREENAKMLKVFLFVLLNSLLPFADVGTDAFTVYDLHENGQHLWAWATFYFMWNPFVLNLLKFMYNFIRAACQNCHRLKKKVYVFTNLTLESKVPNVPNEDKCLLFGFLLVSETTKVFLPYTDENLANREISNI